MIPASPAVVLFARQPEGLIVSAFLSVGVGLAVGIYRRYGVSLPLAFLYGLATATLGVAAIAVFGLVAARGNGKEIDPSRITKVEKGDLAKSVVATGKIQPLTKVQIKSKASGIVQRLM